MLEAEEVTLVAFNAAQQIAVDADDRIWHVDSWLDENGDEIFDRWFDPEAPASDIGNNVNWEEWEFVEAVTAYSDFPEGRKWTTFRPDDFDRVSES